MKLSVSQKATLPYSLMFLLGLITSIFAVAGVFEIVSSILMLNGFQTDSLLIENVVGFTALYSLPLSLVQILLLLIINAILLAITYLARRNSQDESTKKLYLGIQILIGISILIHVIAATGGLWYLTDLGGF